MKTKKKRASIGDLIEVETPRGLAYVQYSHRSPRSGALIRVLPGFFRTRPHSFGEMVAEKERFYAFFPVDAAVAQNLVTVVANEEVPKAIQSFPLMRMAGLPDRHGIVRDWWLFDGVREWPVDVLTPEQQSLSINEILGYPVLVQRIADDWTPIGAYLGQEKTSNGGYSEP